MHQSAVLDETVHFLPAPARPAEKVEAPFSAGPEGTGCPLCELRSCRRPPLRFAVSSLEQWLDLNA
jgi:hypothetical protein